MPKNRRHYRVTFNDVWRAHSDALKFGGRPGVRDISLIESAIGRPYSGYYRPVERKAAALVESLAMNHGFVDGNKRTAVIIMALFLERSGYKLDGPPRVLNDQVENMILSVVEHRMDFDDLVEWFKERIKKIS